MGQINSIRNIAIIAHVDHGKTTLVDHLFKQSGLFRENEQIDDRVMDSMALERERGITIAAKNCSVVWNNTKINILDTPGHADFGGEVERALLMVDGAILLVDAAEGPLPQTRFVLKKTLERQLPIIVVVNKIDRQDARPDEVLNEIYDLFIDLDADDQQIEFPILYTIAKDGVAKQSLEDQSDNLTPLFKAIVEHIPAPQCDTSTEFSMLVANLGYSDYLGRLAIGRIQSGTYNLGDRLVRIDTDNQRDNLKTPTIQAYEGLNLVTVDHAVEAGEIIIVSGLKEVEIGDTIGSTELTEAIPRITVDEPTVVMRFGANTSPLSGKEGKLVQPQKIGERLHKEALLNVALQVEELPGGEAFLVKGRGEFQLAILIEQMRREGFELTVGRPEVIMKEIDGVQCEPIEDVVIDCDEEHVGVISEKLAKRRGRMTNMINNGYGRVRLEFSLPSRSLIGFRNQFLTDTRGTGLMNSILAGFEPHRGQFESRTTGSLVADRAGNAIPYALFNLEARGKLFVRPGDPVYEGMIIGEHNKPVDLNVNPCKTKKLTNVRAAGKDQNVQLTPISDVILEEAIEFIRADEQIEVTPNSIRLRKTALDPNQRRERL